MVDRVFWRQVNVLPVIVACIVSTAIPGRAAEFFHGSQVTFTGGPSQPPESRDVGLKVEIGLRGGSAIAPPSGDGAAPPDEPDERSRPLRFSDLSDRAQPDLRDLARDAAPDTRGSALKALAAVGPKDLETASRRTLRESLDDEDGRVVALGARLLADVDDRASVPPLLRLVDCGEGPVEQAAVRALGRLGDERALPDLERLSGLEVPLLSPLARLSIGQIKARRAAVDAGEAAVTARDSSASRTDR